MGAHANTDQGEKKKSPSTAISSMLSYSLYIHLLPMYIIPSASACDSDSMGRAEPLNIEPRLGMGYSSAQLDQAKHK